MSGFSEFNMPFWRGLHDARYVEVRNPLYEDLRNIVAHFNRGNQARTFDEFAYANFLTAAGMLLEHGSKMAPISHSFAVNQENGEDFKETLLEGLINERYREAREQFYSELRRLLSRARRDAQIGPDFEMQDFAHGRILAASGLFTAHGDSRKPTHYILSETGLEIERKFFDD